MGKRQLEVMYCDDIRQETNGKISLMGIYGDNLVLANFPAKLAKLCLVVRILTPKDDPIKSMTLKVFIDDQVLIQSILNEENISDNISVNENGIIAFRFLVTLSEIGFKDICTLRTTVQTEEEVFEGLSLQIDRRSDLI